MGNQSYIMLLIFIYYKIEKYLFKIDITKHKKNKIHNFKMHQKHIEPKNKKRYNF